MTQSADHPECRSPGVQITPSADRTLSDLHCELRSQRRVQDAQIFACDPSPPVLPDFAPGAVRGGPQASTSEAPKTRFSPTVNFLKNQQCSHDFKRHAKNVIKCARCGQARVYAP